MEHDDIKRLQESKELLEKFQNKLAGYLAREEISSSTDLQFSSTARSRSQILQKVDNFLEHGPARRMEAAKSQNQTPRLKNKPSDDPEVQTSYKAYKRSQKKEENRLIKEEGVFPKDYSNVAHALLKLAQKSPQRLNKRQGGHLENSPIAYQKNYKRSSNLVYGANSSNQKNLGASEVAVGSNEYKSPEEVLGGSRLRELGAHPKYSYIVKQMTDEALVFDRRKQHYTEIIQKQDEEIRQLRELISQKRLKNKTKIRHLETKSELDQRLEGIKNVYEKINKQNEHSLNLCRKLKLNLRGDYPEAVMFSRQGPLSHSNLYQVGSPLTSFPHRVPHIHQIPQPASFKHLADLSQYSEYSKSKPTGRQPSLQQHFVKDSSQLGGGYEAVQENSSSVKFIPASMINEESRKDFAEGDISSKGYFVKKKRRSKKKKGSSTKRSKRSKAGGLNRSKVGSVRSKRSGKSKRSGTGANNLNPILKLIEAYNY